MDDLNDTQIITPLGAPESSPQGFASQFFKILAVFVVSGLAVYFLLSAPTYWIRLKYFLDNFGQKNTAQTIVNIDPAVRSVSGAIGRALDQPTFINPNVETQKKEENVQQEKQIVEQINNEITIEDNELVVPKLNVRVPIVWNSAPDEQIMLANLQKGVVHYGFSAAPNEKDGNVFISGHSSYYWWDPGKYKTVFAILDKMVVGDQAFIKYQGKIYIYEVTKSVVVKPDNISVADHTETPTLSLMTCTPVGTALNRLVVQSKLVKAVSADSAMQFAQNPAPTTETPKEEIKETVIPPAEPPQNIPANRDTIELIPGLN